MDIPRTFKLLMVVYKDIIDLTFELCEYATNAQFWRVGWIDYNPGQNC